MIQDGIRKTCRKGHVFYKNSDCPTCPICEEERKPSAGFMAKLPAPARRALEGAGITTLQELSKKSEQEVLTLHGMGPSSIPKLKKALAEAKLSFRKEKQ